MISRDDEAAIIAGVLACLFIGAFLVFSLRQPVRAPANQTAEQSAAPVAEKHPAEPQYPPNVTIREQPLVDRDKPFLVKNMDEMLVSALKFMNIPRENEALRMDEMVTFDRMIETHVTVKVLNGDLTDDMRRELFIDLRDSTCSDPNTQEAFRSNNSILLGYQFFNAAGKLQWVEHISKADCAAVGKR